MEAGPCPETEVSPGRGAAPLAHSRLRAGLIEAIVRIEVKRQGVRPPSGGSLQRPPPASFSPRLIRRGLVGLRGRAVQLRLETFIQGGITITFPSRREGGRVVPVRGAIFNGAAARND